MLLGKRYRVDRGKVSSSQVKYVGFRFSYDTVDPRVNPDAHFLPLVTRRLCISVKAVRGRDQTSLFGAVRPLHQQCGGAGQPPQDPRRPGGREGRAEDAG